MSVKVSSWVWEHSKTGGGDRLLLLAIADCADDDGDNAWPSVATLAKKTQTADRTVQRGIERLEREGCLQVDRGAGRGGTHRYRVLMDNRAAGREPVDGGTPVVDTEPAAGENPAQGVSDCHPVRLTGEVTQLRHRGGDTAVSPERPRTSIRPPNPPARRGARCPHGRAGGCRRCGTNPRAVDRREADVAAAQAEQLEQQRRAVPWCRHPDCSEISRWRDSNGHGARRCPECHPDVVVGRQADYGLVATGPLR